MNTRRLFARSRLQLAFWYALVMGGILTLLGLGVYRAIVQANWMALEREVESIAGTLHDSLEPMLPSNASPTGVLQKMLPDLCLVNQPCQVNPTLIERHTLGISDRSLYYIRLFDYQGNLLAFSPNQPASLSSIFNQETWQTIHPQPAIGIDNSPPFCIAPVIQTNLPGAIYKLAGAWQPLMPKINVFFGF